MTKAQRRVLDFISEFTTEHKYSPTHRQVADGLGKRAISGIAKHVRNLRAEGRLTKPDGCKRSAIRISEGCEECGRLREELKAARNLLEMAARSPLSSQSVRQRA